MTEPHWNEGIDPGDDDAFPEIEAVPPGTVDNFPDAWGSEPTVRDQAAIDSGAADEALFQELIDSGWTPPPAGQHAVAPVDGDPATAQIDTGYATAPDPMADDGEATDTEVIWID